MTAYRSKQKGSKKPRINNNIEKDIDGRKRPHSISYPVQYDKMAPGWSFTRISKETEWTFLPDEFIQKQGDCINSKCILSRLASFENMNWSDIKNQTHDKNKSSNHFIEDFSKLCKKAKRRLRDLNILEDFFSLRLENKKRIYGILRSNVLEILWYDNNHEIYPTDN